MARLRVSGEPIGGAEAAEIEWAATELSENRDVRVVVLETAGPDFGPGPADDLDPLTVDPTVALSALRPPVVAALRGKVWSVGLEVALAADVRVAAPGTTFALPDVSHGRLPCWGATQRLPRIVGRPQALALVVFGEELDAEQAAAAGLVHQVADDVSDVVDRLLTLAPLALEYAKEAVWRGSEIPLRDALMLEGDLNHLLQASDDRAEGLTAFFDKRAPRFEGR